MDIDPGLAVLIYAGGVFVNITIFLVMSTFLVTLGKGEEFVGRLPRKLRAVAVFLVAVPWLYAVILFGALLCMLVAMVVYTVHEFLEL